VLFLYRPPQTWMPFASPRGTMQQAEYNRRLQDSFAATRRVAPREAAATDAPGAERDPIAALDDLAALHRSGALTDAEFAAAKAKLLGTGDTAR
jgi:hypothetical protein